MVQEASCCDHAAARQGAEVSYVSQPPLKLASTRRHRRKQIRVCFRGTLPTLPRAAMRRQRVFDPPPPTARGLREALPRTLRMCSCFAASAASLA